MTHAKSAQLSPLLQQATGVTAVRGEGAYIFDGDGRRYLDFTSGIGVTATGHCHPRVVEATQKQCAEIVHAQYTTFKHPRLMELVERLGEKLPGDLDRLFFASAGTESVEAAIRLAKQATGRTNIIVFQGSFHGRTTGSLSLTTSGAGMRQGLQPLMSGVAVAPFPDTYHYGWDADTTTAFCLRELDRILATYSSAKETAAFFIEPVQGDGGYLPCTPGFLEGLRERADRHGILLVCDEVQAGFGRSGKFWSHEHYGITPDVLITAKGLASGFPLSAMAASEALMKKGWMGSQGGTYGGNAVSCAAATATLEVIDSEGLVERAERVGGYLRGKLDALAEKHACIGDVRGMGLMHGTLLVDADGKPDGGRVAAIMAEAEKRGVLFIKCGVAGEVLRWLPALIVDEAQCDVALKAFEEAVEATA